MHQDVANQIAKAHLDDLRQEAERARLARLATSRAPVRCEEEA